MELVLSCACFQHCRIATNPSSSPSMQSCVTETISYQSAQMSASATASNVFTRIGCDILEDGFTFYRDDPVAVPVNAPGNDSNSAPNSSQAKSAQHVWVLVPRER